MCDTISWPTNPGRFELEDTHVHVWRADLDCEKTALPRLESTLAPEEKGRADRLIFRSDRDTYVATRGILRQLLGGYLNRSPADVTFHYGPRGKPTLYGESLERSIQFSVSHSGRMALLAFAAGRHIGIDLEFIRPTIAALEIAERYFSPQEVIELRALPGSRLAEAFFLCWTRKEAYVKAKGEGLHIPLDSFTVSLTPEQAARLECADSYRWSIRSLRPAPLYVGALVAEGQAWRLCQWTWNSEGRG